MKTLLTAAVLASAVTSNGNAADGLTRLKFNHPGLTVDLGFGLWAYPLPLDCNGDGVTDLVGVPRRQGPFGDHQGDKVRACALQRVRRLHGRVLSALP